MDSNKAYKNRKEQWYRAAYLAMFAPVAAKFAKRHGRIIVEAGLLTEMLSRLTLPPEIENQVRALTDALDAGEQDFDWANNNLADTGDLFSDLN